MLALNLHQPIPSPRLESISNFSAMFAFSVRHAVVLRGLRCAPAPQDDGYWTPRARWHTDAEFSRRMLHEWRKIAPYKARGFIAEWP
jgi:hypothetical protein